MDIVIEKEQQDKISESVGYLVRLRKVLDGLTEFANIRDKEEAGDWIVVAQVSDLVSRSIGDMAENIMEALEVGDTGKANEPHECRRPRREDHNVPT